MAVLHEVERVRHEVRLRTLEVAKVNNLTPRMIRVTFTGPDLEGFVSLGPADHIKVFFSPAGAEPVLPA
ncbi:siderophore-interacting protein [Fodinicola feengrottensis]|uniref:siderophore-interacting protein n=1 Tax=Fodinicola feengrottensis TaxID=435914 RepID=UPI0024429891|nr:siderophore-interacting protein [Fodinicola feengrottensis]